MTHSKLSTRTYWTSDRSSRNGAKIDRFIIHHAATTSLSGILSLFLPGGRTVSANYALKDRDLVATIPEEYRAWTSGSAHWDGRAVTIEVANSRMGNPWPVSDASFDTLAKLIADVAFRYKFPINDNTILTHQELYLRYGASYATACPGDLQRRKAELLRLANKYLADLNGGKVVQTPVTSNDYGYGLTKNAQEDVQRLLKEEGLYKGAVDGVFGKNSVAGFQTKLKQLGHLKSNYKIDGIPGPLYGGAIQDLATKYGYTGPHDNVPGSATSAAISRWVESVLDSPTGQPGSIHITEWPYAEYALEPGDTQGKVADKFGMSLERFRTLNGKPDGNFTSWPVGLKVRVALDYAPLTYKYLQTGTDEPVAIAQLQRRLKAAYLSYSGSVKINGIYDSATRNAVIEFQRRTDGLGASGRVDQKTWDAVHALSSETTSVTTRKGDTFWSIARDNGTTVDNLTKLNPNVNHLELQVGSTIRIR